MNTFHLRILAADRPFFEGDCQSLIFPAWDGLYGINAYHTNMVSPVVPGELSLKTADDKEIIAAVSAGLIRIDNNDVLILVNSAEHPDEIDINLAKKEAEIIKENMLHKMSKRERASARMKMARELSRISVKRRHM